MAGKPEDVTLLLQAWSDGDKDALESLIPIVYGELHRLAHRYVAGERRGHLLNTTALIHEAYVKLAKIDRMNWKNRCHFFAISAQQMRRILVDFARSRNATKRGGGLSPETLTDEASGQEEMGIDLLALDQALERLEKVAPRKAQVVELRFFAGLTVKEAAEALDVSPDTIMRDWRLAKAWLYREIHSPEG